MTDRPTEMRRHREITLQSKNEIEREKKEIEKEREERESESLTKLGKKGSRQIESNSPIHLSPVVWGGDDAREAGNQEVDKINLVIQ